MSVVWRESRGDPLHNSDEAGANRPQTMGPYSSSSSVWEIEEENSGELFEIDNAGRCDMPSIKEELDGSVFSFDFHNRDYVVYVAVGKNDSSMDALLWTLNHALSTDRTLVFLIHVFPELRFIPTPCKLSLSLSSLIVCVCVCGLWWVGEIELKSNHRHDDLGRAKLKSYPPFAFTRQKKQTNKDTSAIISAYMFPSQLY